MEMCYALCLNKAYVQTLKRKYKPDEIHITQSPADPLQLAGPKYNIFFYLDILIFDHFQVGMERRNCYSDQLLFQYMAGNTYCLKTDPLIISPSNKLMLLCTESCWVPLLTLLRGFLDDIFDFGC